MNAPLPLTLVILSKPPVVTGPHFCRPPPGSIWLPLERLDKQAVAGLGCARLAVLATGDLRGQQACVRLRDVFGCSETVLVTEWER